MENNIIELIENSKSMDSELKEEWIELLPDMNEYQKERLIYILEKEQNNINLIDNIK